MDMIRINNGRNESCRINVKILRKLFPQLPDHYLVWNEIDISAIVHDLKLLLPSLIDLSTVQNALRSLFDIAKKYSGWSDNLAPQISSKFRNFLQKDMRKYIHGKPTIGLGKSRHFFVVLACLAHKTRSKILGSALIECFMEHHGAIMGQERTRWLPEWTAAIEGLKSLAPYDNMIRCLQLIAKRRSDMTEYFKSGLDDPRIDAILNLLHWVVGEDFERGRRHLRRLPAPSVMTVPRWPSPSPPLPLPPPPDHQLALRSPSPPLDLALQNTFLLSKLEEMLYKQAELEQRLERMELEYNLDI